MTEELELDRASPQTVVAELNKRRMSARDVPHDYLHISKNAALVSFLNRSGSYSVEEVVFSDSVLKSSSRGKHQERHFIISNRAIYYFKPDTYHKPQRETPLHDISGVVVSSSSGQILIQVHAEHDYLLDVIHRMEALEQLAGGFEKVAEKGLPCSVSEEQDLHFLMVTKTEIRNIVVSPTTHRQARRRMRSLRNLSVTSVESLELSSSSRPTGFRSFIKRRSQSEKLLSQHNELVIMKMCQAEDVKTERMRPQATSTHENILDKIAMEGWLAKKGVNNAAWKRRYFILPKHSTSPCLLYYMARAKGSVCITADGCLRFVKTMHQEASQEIVHKTEEFSADRSRVESMLLTLADRTKLESFRAYLQSCFMDETIACYCAIGEFRQLWDGSPDQEAAAKTLWEKHLDPNSPTSVTVPPPILEEVMCSMRESTSRTVFDVVRQYLVEHFLRDAYPRYLLHLQTAHTAHHMDQLRELEASDQANKTLAPSCGACMKKFPSDHTPRLRCPSCLDVMCQDCMVQSCVLPAHMSLDADKENKAKAKASSKPWPLLRSKDRKKGGSSSSSSKGLVCDLCAASIQNPTLFVFAYVNRSRKSLILAAESEDSFHKWTSALRRLVVIDETGCGKVVAKFEGYVHQEGWLLRMSDGKWSRHYFVLELDRLWTYEMMCKGQVPLYIGGSVQVVEGVEEAGGVENTATNTATPSATEAVISMKQAKFGGLTSQSGFAFRFNLSCGERLYMLSADTTEDVRQWRDAVEAVLRNSEGGGEQAGNVSSDVIQLVSGVPQFQEAPENEVTLVFTDVQNSTNLWSSCPDEMDQALELHDSILRECLTKHNGYEVKTEGDAFMVTFFTPVEAVLWCLDVQNELLQAKWPAKLSTQTGAELVMADDGHAIFNGIRIRMGIHSGFPSCRPNPITGRMDYYGPVVNQSARVADSGHGGQIVATQEVYDAIGKAMRSGNNPFLANPVVAVDLGEYQYKGISAPVRVFEVVSPALARRKFPPLRIKK